jgi:hypothetical protein
MFVGLCLAVTASALGADDDVSQLIDRALKAHGGADRLALPRSYTVVVEMTSKSKRSPAGVSSTATHSFQPPNQYRLEEDALRGGRPSKYIEVYNGNRGWTKRDCVLQAMDPKDRRPAPGRAAGLRL